MEAAFREALGVALSGLESALTPAAKNDLFNKVTWRHGAWFDARCARFRPLPKEGGGERWALLAARC